MGGKSTDLAGRAIDADVRAYLEGVTLDAALKLLIAVLGQPHRTAGQEDRSQRDIEREGGMVASTESAAHIGKQGFYVRRFERNPRFTEHVCKPFSGLVRRLDAEYEREVFGARVVPGDAAFRLEKHRVDRLGLEFAVQRQNCRIACCKFGADLLAMGCGFGVGAPGRNREPRPYRALTVLEMARTDPAVLDRRVNIGGVRGRAGDTGETKCAVVGPHDRAGFLTELDESSIAKGEPRLIEGIEFFKDQECDRLAEIQRRLADRAKQI